MERILRNWRWLSGWTAVGAAGMWSTVFFTGWIFLRSQTVATNGERLPVDVGVLVATAVLVGLMQGAVIGGLQAWLLSRRISGLSRAWTSASVLGAGVTIGAGVFALATYGWYYVPHPAAGVALGFGCLAVGCAQARVLGRRTRWAVGWPLVKVGAAFAGICAFAAAAFGWQAFLESMPRVGVPILLLVTHSNEWIILLLVTAVPPVLYGLLTGLPLVALFDERRVVRARAA